MTKGNQGGDWRFSYATRQRLICLVTSRLPAQPSSKAGTPMRNSTCMMAARRGHMRYLIVLLALALAAGLLVACTESAQPKNESAAVAPAAPESRDKVEAEILQLEKDWV